MTLRTLALTTTALLALAATSCSGSAPPPAQGSMYIHVFAASNTPAGKQCTVAPHNAQIGTQPPTATDPGSRVVDGNGGATVNCTVVAGGTFRFNGNINKGAVSFQITGKIPTSGGKPAPGTASINSFDPTSGHQMASDSAIPCTVTPIQVASGHIWASYKCPGFVDTSSPTNYCQADGVFVFENCKQQ